MMLIYYKKINIKPLISHRWDYKEITEAYQKVWELDPTVTGGVIHWQ